ncbi:hypothetical protein HZI73_12195 [Vallitalea pronyensis]|uniref:Uncharacterized protein n=1 Tax=Vallitalea pronyensis TaxID=1348613 RepID=A0A8J8SGQ3_9FIRM|nr:hypothetical protein [Vallitalea pronyensis]QUI23005.1 hypothetical protein HZI73_12195 [Vallitalea pronyensis]
MACVLLTILPMNNAVQAQSSFNTSHYELQLEYANRGPQFGDTRTVSVSSPVPSGWVITWKGYSSMTIKYVVGASYGYSLTVSVDSPVPPNWIITWKGYSSMTIEYVGN